MKLPDEYHRGYRIMFFRNNRSAIIYRPDEDRPMREMPTRDKGETPEDLRAKAYALIDADLDGE